jgi:hypothetical protein
MTDRTYSGSAGLRDHRNIEIMINRRMAGQDYYGVDEILSETDIFGNGIEV